MNFKNNFLLIKVVFLSSSLIFSIDDYDSLLQEKRNQMGLELIKEVRKYPNYSILNMKKLVYAGANLNIKNESSLTALMLSTYYTSIVLVKFLIGNGADVNIRDSENISALDIAYSYKDAKLSDVLLNFKNNLIKQFAESINKEDEFKIKKILVVYPYIVDDNGNNALHIAGNSRKLNMFKFIMEIKPGLINNKNFVGFTPLDLNQEMLFSLIRNFLEIEENKNKNKKRKLE